MEHDGERRARHPARVRRLVAHHRDVAVGERWSGRPGARAALPDRRRRPATAALPLGVRHQQALQDRCVVHLGGGVGVRPDVWFRSRHTGQGGPAQGRPQDQGRRREQVRRRARGGASRADRASAELPGQVGGGDGETRAASAEGSNGATSTSEREHAQPPSVEGGRFSRATSSGGSKSLQRGRPRSRAEGARSQKRAIATGLGPSFERHCARGFTTGAVQHRQRHSSY